MKGESRHRGRASLYAKRACWPALVGLLVVAPRADAAGPGPASPLPQQTFAPKGQGARFYNAPPVRGPAPTPMQQAVVAVAARAAKAAGRAAPIADPRLDAAAADLAAVIPNPGMLPNTVTSFALQHHGVIEPTPALSVTFAPPESTAAVADYFATQLGRSLGSGDYARMGVGSAMRQDGRQATVLLLLRSRIETDPIPRMVGSRRAVVIRARLAAQWREPGVVVTPEEGASEHFTFKPHRGGKIQARVPCRGRRGMLQVEVTADSQVGNVVLANFPVWCGVDAPTQIAWQVVDDAPTADLGAAERQMVELVNDARRQQGLSPLLLHPGLAEVARAHSRDMVARNQVAHVLDGATSAFDRVQRAGIVSRHVAENLARAGHVSDAHTGLMQSPGHRVNILAPEMTHLGIGIAPGPLTGDHPDLFITQLFMREHHELSPGATKQQARSIVEAGSGLARDTDLDRLAQTHAEATAGGTANTAATQTTMAAIQGAGLRFLRVRAVLAAVTSIEAFTGQDPGAVAGMSHYGLGIARGHHSELGKEALFIVVLLAKRG